MDLIGVVLAGFQPLCRTLSDLFAERAKTALFAANQYYYRIRVQFLFVYKRRASDGYIV